MFASTVCMCDVDWEVLDAIRQNKAAQAAALQASTPVKSSSKVPSETPTKRSKALEPAELKRIYKSRSKVFQAVFPLVSPEIKAANASPFIDAFDGKTWLDIRDSGLGCIVCAHGANAKGFPGGPH